MFSQHILSNFSHYIKSRAQNWVAEENWGYLAVWYPSLNIPQQTLSKREFLKQGHAREKKVLPPQNGHGV